MATVVPVDDPDDPRLDDYRHLTDAALRRRVEHPDADGAGGSDGGGGHGLFVAEGTTVIRRLLTSPYRTRSVLVSPDKLAVLRDDLDPLDITVFVGSLDLLRGVAGFDLHRGAVAAADRRPPTGWQDLASTAGTLAVLEGLNDHENLGAIARSAAALGVDGLVLDPTCADPLYRRSVRVSMGELLHLPFATMAPWPAALADLKHLGFVVLALTPDADAVPIDTVTLAAGRRVAIVLGAEGPGLSAATLAAADAHVRIPLAAGVDSLNVGHAAAIAFHCLRVRPT